MLVVGGGLCPGTSINDRQADRTPGQPLTKSCFNHAPHAHSQFHSLSPASPAPVGGGRSRLRPPTGGATPPEGGAKCISCTLVPSSAL